MSEIDEVKSQCCRGASSLVTVLGNFIPRFPLKLPYIHTKFTAVGNAGGTFVLIRGVRPMEFLDVHAKPTDREVDWPWTGSFPGPWVQARVADRASTLKR